MTRHRHRLYWWGIGSVIALAMLMTSALLLAEYMVNRPATIRQISALATRHIGGPVHFSALRLSLFFTPHITLEGLRGYLPGKIGVTARKLSVYPSYKALLTGKLPIGAIRVDAPEIFAALPPPGRRDKTDETDLAALVSGAVGTVAGKLPYLQIAVDSGRLTITGDAFAGMTLEDIHARLSIPDSRLAAACSSAAWKRLKLALNLDTESLDISGEALLSGLDLAAVAAMFPEALPAATGKTDASLEVRFNGHGARIASATATLAMPGLDMPLPGGALSLGDIRIAGDYADNPETRTIRLTTLTLARPQIDAKASVITTKKPPAGSPRHQVTATAAAADLGSIRSALDAAMGRQPTVATLLGIVRGGHATDLAFTVSGDTPEALGAFEKMTISGRIENAAIQVPGVNLALSDAAGRVLIQNGVLQCEAASARTGHSRAANGKLQLGLTGGSDVFRLTADVSADLADLPPVLTRILQEKNRQWLDAVTGLSGKAAGTLTLGERLSDLHVAVDVSSLAGTAGINGLPGPVRVSAGKVRVTEKALSVSDASAAMGGCSVAGYSGRLAFRKPLAEMRADRVTLDTAELYPWLTQKPELAAVQEIVGAMSGLVTLEGLTWKGALDRPREGEFFVTGSSDALTLTSGLLPGPLTLSFRQVTLRPNRTAITGASARWSDANLALSGNLVTDAGGIKQADVRLTGQMGDAFFRQLAAGGRLPPQLIIRPPLNVTNLKIGWQRGRQLSIGGDLRMANGPLISIDAALAQEDVDIRRLRISDAVSDGSFRFQYHKMGVEAGFTGKLLRGTVDQLLADNTLLLGTLEGNVTLMLPLENPAAFELDGDLRADRLFFPDWRDKPLQIHALDIRSKGRRADISALDMHLLGSHLKVQGSAELGADKLSLALSIDADHVDVTRWIAAGDALEEKKPSTPDSATAEKAPPRELNAMLNLTIGEVAIGRLKWAPVDASLTITPGELAMVFTKAEICGIAHPGSVTLSRDAVSAEFAPSAKGQDLNTTLNCLAYRPVDLTGTFDLSGKVTANGPRGNISQILAGDIHVATSSGQIYHAESLENIFSLLNLPGIIEGGPGKQRKKGLDYDIISADIKIGDGVVTLEKGAMKGPLMQLAFQGDIGIQDQAMDVTVFVVPLKSIVSVASKIPFIGRIISGDLISIPVKISGTMKAPRYLPLSPDAVGQQAVRILKDIIQLPVDIIQPIVPSGGGSATSPPRDKQR